MIGRFFIPNFIWYSKLYQNLYDIIGKLALRGSFAHEMCVIAHRRGKETARQSYPVKS